MAGLRDIYRGMRKPTPPPTKVERDERAKIREKRDRREMRSYEKKRGRKGAWED